MGKECLDEKVILPETLSLGTLLSVIVYIRLVFPAEEQISQASTYG